MKAGRETYLRLSYRNGWEWIEGCCSRYEGKVAGVGWPVGGEPRLRLLACWRLESLGWNKKNEAAVKREG